MNMVCNANFSSPNTDSNLDDLQVLGKSFGDPWQLFLNNLVFKSFSTEHLQ